MVASEAAPDAARYLDRHERLGMDEAQLAAADHVVDLDADEVSCPACGATFANVDVTGCPECGLRLG